jgi:1-pyrroline-5-carboxylate dehydrogenase
MTITFATLSVDNEELQSAVDDAIAKVRREWLGAEIPMYINGEEVYALEKYESYSPMNTELHLSTAQRGTVEHARAAIAAARVARADWACTPWQRRVAIVRKASEIMSERVLELSALLAFEVGKSRLEAIGEVNEALDLVRYYAASMEKNNGFAREMGKLDPADEAEFNMSVLRPYGVWGVISPWNFPIALSLAPTTAALLTGNTVVFKGSLETPQCAWRMSELFIEAGVPTGVFNSVLGPDEEVGQELLDNPHVDGWTFTGSYDVGMKVLKNAANGLYPRPTIIEMGGKNPAIISNTADLDKAALGVMRAAFGMDGEKCSACSRVYVQDGVYDAFRKKLVALTADIVVGDPTRRDVFMGALIHQQAYDDYRGYIQKARQDGQVIVGGEALIEGTLANGYYVEPAIVEGLAEDHELVVDELFVPILHMARVQTLEEAMEKANNTQFGLTAGFFGEDEQEVDWFLENIQAGTVYVNRAASATTGGWPGVQCFGGWKASSSSGKGVGGNYTLSLYMHEQSRTIIG